MDRKSKNTRDSARNVPGLAVFQRSESPALVTVGYHGERAWRRFDEAGVDFNYVVASEDIVAERSVEDAAAVETWRNQPHVRLDMAKEHLINKASPFEAIGSFAVKLSRR